ncbi:MAG: hypothetical protein U0Q18_16995 [Bryobacteraceae bacterium]
MSEPKDRFQKKILAALHGVEFFDPDKHKDLPQDLERLLIGQKEPTSRFLKLALSELHGRKLPTGDKIEWKAYIVFRGATWYIHDWKHSSWTLYGPANAETTSKQLLKKLEAAAKAAESSLEARSKAKITAGDFALAHQFWMLQSYYQNLRKQAEVMLGLRCEPETGVALSTFKLPTGGTVTEYNMPGTNAYFAERRACEAAAAGAVVLFFGMMELVFDACFAFGNRNGLTYQQFRSKDWKERFQHAISVDASPAKEIYQELLLVQQRYRNVFSHALPLFMVFHQESGWVPSDMSRVTELNSNPLFGFKESDLGAIFALFDRADKLFEDDPHAWAAVMYVQAPLPIPLAPAAVASLLKHASSRDEFAAEIERRTERFEAHMNGEL